MKTRSLGGFSSKLQSVWAPWLRGLCSINVTLFLLLQALPLGRAGEVAGVISSDTHWTRAAGPYDVVGHLTVAEGATLTIDPGVLIRFAQYQALFVQGALRAAGTEALPIRFEGASAISGWWRGIQFSGTGQGSFDHCTIVDSGYWDSVAVSAPGQGTVVLRNSIIANTVGDGLRLPAGFSNLTSSGNHFRNNLRAVRLGIGASFDDASSRFEGNGIDVLAEGGTMNGSAIWNLHSDYSVFAADNVVVSSGGSLVIAPGTVVKFAQYTGMWIVGELNATGTAAQPIHFTEMRDDTVGGDANRNGAASAPAPGYWQGVFVEGAGRATLAHLSVRYAGYWNSLTLRKSGTGSLNLNSVSISDSSSRGLVIAENSGSIALVNSSFKNNGAAGLELNAAGTPGITACLFENNGSYGVLQSVNDALPYSSNTFAGNALGSVGINGGTLATNAVWSRGAGDNFNIVLRDHITVGPEATLSIEPGVTVRAAQYSGLFVDGGIQARGTAGEPVRFTGVTEQPGWWRGLQIRGAGSADLAHAVVACAGYWDSVGVLKSGSGALSIRDSTLRNHTGDALRVAAGYSSFESRANQFQNSVRGVRLGVNVSFDDVTATFLGNDLDVFADGGTVTQPVLWHVSPAYSIWLSGNLTVTSEGKLTIGAGTVVKLAQYIGIWVDGKLEALGTAGQPIYFTESRDDAVGGDANRDQGESAPDVGFWRGIYVQNEGVASLTHSTIRYGGYWDSLGLRKSGAGALGLTNCTVEEIAGTGIAIMDNSGLVGLVNTVLQTNRQSGLQLRNSGPVAAESSVFAGNGHYGILQEANDRLGYSGNRFEANALGSVGVNGGILAGDAIWSRGLGGDFDIIARGHLAIGADATLRIEPGIAVRAAQYIAVSVQGHLHAAGTAGQPVVFSGTTEQPGWWRGLQISEAGSARLEHCVVAFGGYWDSVNLAKSGSGSLSLIATSIRGGSGDGLRLDGSTGGNEIVESSFTSNRVGVLARNQTSGLILSGSRIEGNDLHGVRNDSAPVIDARQVWWGSASGPLHPSNNPAGQGNPVSDRVLFDPWLQSVPSHSGTLTVWIEPEAARDAGAKWSVDGTIWLASGVSTQLATGSWTVRFTPAAGWTPPTDTAVEIPAGGTITKTGTYTPRPGSNAIFTVGPQLGEARMGHHAAKLPDGRIALFGGHGSGFTSLATAEIWDANATSSSSFTMVHSHDQPAFVQLSDGRLLLAGGSIDLGIPRFAESELFDPVENRFYAQGNMARFRAGAGACALGDGRVLIAGAWWTHNDAHTYGEIWNPGSGQFTATGPLNVRRAFPWVLPVEGGGAVVIGGVGANGEFIEAPVERFNPEDGSFSILKPQLFSGESGWTAASNQQYSEAQKLADGRYLMMAYRNVGGITEYALFHFDPATLAIARMATDPPLPDSATFNLWPPLIDVARSRAVFVAQAANSSAPELRTIVIQLDTGAMGISANSHRLEPVYSLSGAGLALLSDGRIFVTGGSEDGSNFRPVVRTLLIAPQDVSPAVRLRVQRVGEHIHVSWAATGKNYQLESSTDLYSWAKVPSLPQQVGGEFRVVIDPSRKNEFFRLAGD